MSLVKTLQSRELGLRSGPAKKSKYSSSAPPFNSYEKVKIFLDLAKVTSSQQATQLEIVSILRQLLLGQSSLSGRLVEALLRKYEEIDLLVVEEYPTVLEVTAAVTEELSDIMNTEAEFYSIPEIGHRLAYLVTSRQICPFGTLSYQDRDLSSEADHSE